MCIFHETENTLYWIILNKLIIYEGDFNIVQ